MHCHLVEPTRHLSHRLQLEILASFNCSMLNFQFIFIFPSSFPLIQRCFSFEHLVLFELLPPFEPLVGFFRTAPVAADEFTALTRLYLTRLRLQSTSIRSAVRRPLESGDSLGKLLLFGTRCAIRCRFQQLDRTLCLVPAISFIGFFSIRFQAEI